MTITLAIPSKGRLKDQALEILAKAGLAVSLPGDERKYRARIEGATDIEIAFLSASEIAGEIGQGSVDLGITGEDLLRENVADWESKAEIVARLGFGHADVVVAVPDIWLDVDTMADLDDVAADFRQRHGRRLRIATKYWRLTQQFFSASTASRSIASSRASAPPKARRPPARPTSSSTSPRPARRCAPTISRCWPTG